LTVEAHFDDLFVFAVGIGVHHPIPVLRKEFSQFPTFVHGSLLGAVPDNGPHQQGCAERRQKTRVHRIIFLREAASATLPTRPGVSNAFMLYRLVRGLSRA